MQETTRSSSSLASSAVRKGLTVWRSDSLCVEIKRQNMKSRGAFAACSACCRSAKTSRGRFEEPASLSRVLARLRMEGRASRT